MMNSITEQQLILKSWEHGCRILNVYIKAIDRFGLIIYKDRVLINFRLDE